MKIFNPIKSIKLFFAKKLQKKIEKKIIEKKTTDYLQWLIDEYRLIQKKESQLSLSERNKVISEIEKYIESGYINVN